MRRAIKQMAVMGLLFLSMIVEATDTKDLELWFFHDQSCPWCHHMAPDVKVVSKILNIKTVGLPDKGEAIEGFDEVRQDNQAYRTHRVIYMPALILVNCNVPLLMRVKRDFCFAIC